MNCEKYLFLFTCLHNFSNIFFNFLHSCSFFVTFLSVIFPALSLSFSCSLFCLL